MVGQRRRLLRVERDARVAGELQPPALVADDPWLDAVARDAREDVDVREEADRRRILVDRCRQRRRHVRVVVDLGVLEPERAQLLEQQP